MGKDQNQSEVGESLEKLLNTGPSFFLKNKKVVHKNLYLGATLNKLSELTLPGRILKNPQHRHKLLLLIHP